MTFERPRDATSDPALAPAVETAPSPGVPRVALILVGIAAAVLLLRYTREALIPFALAGLLFYALDPVVDWMQKWRIPRALGAFAAIMVVL